MTIYIQRKSQVFALETVDEFPTFKEARMRLKEYRISDPSAGYYPVPVLANRGLIT